MSKKIYRQHRQIRDTIQAKIVIGLGHYEKTIVFKIYWMDERGQYARVILPKEISSILSVIRSVSVPELTSDTLYLRGSDKSKDNRLIAWEVPPSIEGKNYVHSILVGLRYWAKEAKCWEEKKKQQQTLNRNLIRQEFNIDNVINPSLRLLYI